MQPGYGQQVRKAGPAKRLNVGIVHIAAVTRCQRRREAASLRAGFLQHMIGKPAPCHGHLRLKPPTSRTWLTQRSTPAPPLNIADTVEPLEESLPVEGIVSRKSGLRRRPDYGPAPHKAAGRHVQRQGVGQPDFARPQIASLAANGMHP